MVVAFVATESNRQEKVRFLDQQEKARQRARVIFCCSEKSVYDPSQGARVLGGPAKQPLTAIGLEYDAASDRLYATGTHGGELYDQFFAKFGFRLQLEFRATDIQRQAAESAEVVTLEEYTEQRVVC